MRRGPAEPEPDGCFGKVTYEKGRLQLCFSHLLRKALNGHEGAKVKHYMDRIQQGVARMGQLIEGLLSLAQTHEALGGP